MPSFDLAENPLISAMYFYEQPSLAKTPVEDYKKPFDLISEAVKMQAEEEERTGKKFDKTAQNENWLPRLDSNQEPPG